MKAQTIGPYRILETLGRGGMGVVYRAVAPDGRVVALKTVLLPREGMLQSIRREIHALARIDHPGVVRILEEGVEQGLPWFAMELLEGTTLRDYRAPLAEVLRLVRRLCAPLAFIHGEGIVHRDLKPDNIFLAPTFAGSRPVLVDFGLVSRFTGEVSREALEVGGAASGTVAYMAPEQIQGELVDARADLYALGCILYELVSGQRPFVGANVPQIVRGHLSAAPKPLSGLVEGVPPALDALVLRLLAKRPQERIGHAGDVAAALDELVAEDGLVASGPRPRAYLYRPGFAGREEPLGELRERLSGLRAGAGGIYFIGGVSGSGKTRLALELAREAKRQKLRVLTGECVAAAAGPQSHGGSALHPLRPVLQQIADRCREKGPEETERLLGPRGKLLGIYESSLLGLPGQELHPEPAELPAEPALLRLHASLAETLVAMAGGGAREAPPCLLILDDLHWADDVTLGLLGFLLRTRRLEASALLVVGTYRTEEAAPELRKVLEAPGASRMEIGRLDETAVGSMAADMLGLRPPPEALVRSLALLSEGNPFFVAEYLRTAVAEDLLYRDGTGAWRVAESLGALLAANPDAARQAAPLPLPRSLRALVGRRLEGLTAGARHMVEAAAVLGRETDTALIAEVGGTEGPPLMEAVEELLARQVMEEAAPERLRFVHDKILEAAYENIPPAARRELHLAAAEALEAGYGEKADRLAELGYHWERAGSGQRAQRYYLAAARSAAARYAHGDAERLYRSFLALAPEPGAETVQVLNELARDVLHLQGRHREAVEEGRRALEQARQLGDLAGEGLSLQNLSTVHRVLGFIEEAEDLCKQALAVHRALGDRAAEGNALTVLAATHAARGDLEQARGLFEEALLRHREVGARRLEAVTLSNLAVIDQAQGRAEQARTLQRQALALHREVGNRRSEGITLDNLATIEMEEGRVEEAEALLQAALGTLREVGDPYSQARVLRQKARLLRQAGREVAEAEQLLREAERLLEPAGNPLEAALCLCEAGHLALAQGLPAQSCLGRTLEQEARLRVGPASELGKAAARLRRAVEAAEAGTLLFRGECVEDLPQGLRLWLAETGQLPRDSGQAAAAERNET